MASLSIGSNLPAQIPSAPRTDAARAAQRAFFQAAVTGTAPAQAVPPAKPAATTVSVQAAAAPTAGEPTRYLRPGSLLDIKV